MDNQEDLVRQELALKRRELELRKRDEKLVADLGYKNAHPFYTYQKEFIESKNKMNFLVAANQVGKTSSGIIRCLEHMFSTDEERLELWPDDKYKPGRDVLLIWYFYPDYTTATTAFKTAWQKYLPKGIYLEEKELKEKYGWKEFYGSDRKISHIEFRGGLLQFKAYNQSALNLQMASVYEVFLDEELPYRHYPEITSRMNFTEGYYNMVFTATLGEPEWYDTMEKQGEPGELFPHARKWNISLWDCMKYEDGSPSIWTKKKIIATTNKYGTKEEIQRRIEGRFVVDSRTLVYSAFHNDIIIEPYKIPRDWSLWAGIDLGKGLSNHKSAIAAIAVRPDRKEAVVFVVWREDSLPTEPIDVLNKYRELVRVMPSIPHTFYDHAAADFKKVVDADGVFNMYKADKSQDSGIGLLNSLMKNKMLKFFNSSDVPKAFQECRLVKTHQTKNHRRDDVMDALRFAVTRIDWDWSDVSSDKIIQIDNGMRNELNCDTYNKYIPERTLVAKRQFMKDQEPVLTDLDSEFDDFNDSIFGYEGDDDYDY